MKKNKRAFSGTPLGTASEAKVSATAAESRSVNLKNILVPIDFSEPSRKALEYARQMALGFGASVTLLYVLEPIPYPYDFSASYPLVADNPELLKTAGGKLKELAATLKAGSEPVKSLMRQGNPAHEICAAAQELGIDLIIIATHGYTGLKHVLLGSTAEKVVRHAPCPVLTVRERA